MEAVVALAVVEALGGEEASDEAVMVEVEVSVEVASVADEAAMVEADMAAKFRG